jgi:hypothetical protein
VNANPSSPASVTTVVDGLETGEQWFDAAYNWAGEASSLGAQIRSLVAGSWNVQEGTFAGRQVIEHLTDIELQQIEGQGGSGC